MPSSACSWPSLTLACARSPARASASTARNATATATAQAVRGRHGQGGCAVRPRARATPLRCSRYPRWRPMWPVELNFAMPLPVEIIFAMLLQIIMGRVMAHAEVVAVPSTRALSASGNTKGDGSSDVAHDGDQRGDAHQASEAGGSVRARSRKATFAAQLAGAGGHDSGDAAVFMSIARSGAEKGSCSGLVRAAAFPGRARPGLRPAACMAPVPCGRLRDGGHLSRVHTIRACAAPHLSGWRSHAGRSRRGG